MQINNFKILLDDKYISLNTNNEKEDLKSNEQLLSFGNNLFSNEYENEKDIQNQNEGINIMNYFDDNYNISKIEDIIPFNKYFIEDKSLINYDNQQESNLIKTMKKKETTKLRKKRKSIKEVKEIIIKKHTALDDDNILRKVQVQFISFIIHYSNDVISFLVKGFEKKPSFQDVDYELKKVVNHKNVESLKKKAIGEIIQFNITSKFKKKEKNENEKTLKILLKKCPSLEEYFKTNYLDLFIKYYNNENDIFEVDGKRIPLSEKTKKKTFSSLIKKKKNNNLKERIKYVCINYLINSYKKMNKPKFQITTLD